MERTCKDCGIDISIRHFNSRRCIECSDKRSKTQKEKYVLNNKEKVNKTKLKHYHNNKDKYIEYRKKNPENMKLYSKRYRDKYRDKYPEEYKNKIKIGNLNRKEKEKLKIKPERFCSLCEKKIDSIMAKYCKECRVIVLKKQQSDYHKRNPEKAKKWSIENPEKAKENKKLWAKKNIDKARQSSLTYYHNNKDKDKYIERRKQYERNNPDKIKANRKKKEIKAIKNAYPRYIKTLLKKQGFTTEDITAHPELIEVKQLILKIKRL
jgi:hypothetical protein